MAETSKDLFDREQVKKAVHALQAFLKSKSTSEAKFLDETQQITILFTLWKIPKKQQTIRIPLPHNQRTDTDEVCLFTRDEPNMTPDQTQRFYKRLLQEKGIQNITEIIPYKMLKTEYKAYEAKRRLLGNFDLFLSDDRIQRLLPSHLGKHFYQSRREPLSVDLQSNHLAREVKGIIQGTRIKINNKGCCCMARIGHSGMTAEEITENVESAVKTVVAKMLTKGPVMKVIHLKSQASIALPIYTSDLSHLTILEEAQKKVKLTTIKGKRKAATKVSEKPQQVDGDDDDEIPQLVPIATPIKKPKLKPQKKKTLEKVPKAAVQKVPKAAVQKVPKAAVQKVSKAAVQKVQKKRTRKRGKTTGKTTSQKPKRTAPKIK